MSDNLGQKGSQQSVSLNSDGKTVVIGYPTNNSLSQVRVFVNPSSSPPIWTDPIIVINNTLYVNKVFNIDVIQSPP